MQEDTERESPSDKKGGRGRRGRWSGLSFLGDPSCPSWLPIKNRIPPQTVCVFSRTPPGCFLATAQDSHTTPVLSFSLSHSIPSWLTFLSLFRLRPVYYQHVAHVLDKSRGSFAIGVGWQHQPRTPLFPRFFSPPSSCFPPSLSPFSILSCRGKRGPEESNNCDSGAFLALFLKLCRHTQRCLLALMKG